MNRPLPAVPAPSVEQLDESKRWAQRAADDEQDHGADEVEPESVGTDGDARDAAGDDAPPLVEMREVDALAAFWDTCEDRQCLDRAMGETDEDRRHDFLSYALPEAMRLPCPCEARLRELLASARRPGAAPAAPSKEDAPSPEGYWLVLVGVEVNRLKGEGDAREPELAPVLQRLFDAGYDPAVLRERARAVAAATHQEIVARARVQRRWPDGDPRPRPEVHLTGAYAQFWRDTLPVIDDKTLASVLRDAGFSPAAVHTMGDRAIRESEARSAILGERPVSDRYRGYGGLSTTVPEPVVYNRSEFRDVLQEHARIFRERHDPLAASLGPTPHHEFVQSLAGVVRRETDPDILDIEVGYASRSAVAYRYRGYHGIYRQLFLAPPARHTYVIIHSPRAVSLRLARIWHAGPRKVRLVPDASTVIVEPARQKHEVDGDRIRTCSVAPRNAERAHWRPLRPEPGPWDVVDRLVDLYEPVIRKRLLLEARSCFGEDPAPVLVTVESSPVSGDSIRIASPQPRAVAAMGFPGIAKELAREAPRGWVPVFVTDRFSHGGLRWLRVRPDAGEPAPAPLNEERAQGGVTSERSRGDEHVAARASARAKRTQRALRDRAERTQDPGAPGARETT